VGGDVRGVAGREGASVGEVTIGFGDSEGDPSSGTNAVPGDVGGEPANDDAVGRVVEVFVAPRFVDEVADERFVEGEEVVNDELSGDCVVGGPAVTRLAPPEHETAINVKTNTPTSVQALRTPGHAMAAAYAKRCESDTRPGPTDR
jgi:hypothetical protein